MRAAAQVFWDMLEIRVCNHTFSNSFLLHLDVLLNVDDEEDLGLPSSTKLHIQRQRSSAMAAPEGMEWVPMLAAS